MKQAARGPRRTDFRYVDLAAASTLPSTLPAALEGVDLVVSTVPDPTLAAERHILENGGVMLNLSAEPASALNSLRGVGATDGTVVMNAGIAPGVTNLVAAAMLEEYPDADEVELVFTVTTKGSGGKAAADFAHRGLTGLRRHRVATVRLAPPFGTRQVLGFAEPDGGWLGPSADGVTVSPYICLAERPVQELMLGAEPGPPDLAAATSRAPLAPTHHDRRCEQGTGRPPCRTARRRTATRHPACRGHRGLPDGGRHERGLRRRAARSRRRRGREAGCLVPRGGPHPGTGCRTPRTSGDRGTDP